MRDDDCVGGDAEITLPQTKPETEWINGRAVRKVSPTYRHAKLQALLCAIFMQWAKGRGRVGSEWRFRVKPPGFVRRPLVPDVAYMSYERLPRAAVDDAQVPMIAPDVALEILSPKDRRGDIEAKRAIYLASGTTLVITVDPLQQTVRLDDASGQRHYDRGGLVEHAALPGLQIDTEQLFLEMDE